VIQPDKTQKYKLEVIAKKDGFKDIDQVEITVNPNFIVSISPNPGSNIITVNYSVKDINQAYFVVQNISGNNYNKSHNIDTSQNSKAIDIQSIPAGSYLIAFICDGMVCDTKQFVKL
jgi:hypothetical protein